MTTYRLDETPDIFISGVIEEGSYVFRMNHIEDESKNRYIRNINLRKDKLIVYGTEINETIREKLHSSLILRPNVGKLCVNCNGACYIYVVEKMVYYRLINNVIFDWSLFGVTVPNSAKFEAAENKDEAAKTIESYKEEVKDLKLQLLSSKKDNKYMEMELQMVQRQLSSTVFELLKTSKIIERVAELEEQQSISKRELDDMKGKLRNIEDQVSSVENDNELQSTKRRRT